MMDMTAPEEDLQKSNEEVIFTLPSKKLFLFASISPSKLMKNAFYFTLNALFVLKILTFLSSLFGHKEKTASLER